MATPKKPTLGQIDLSSIFTHRPWGPIADPGPELYVTLQGLPEEHQTAAISAVNEAVASISAAKAKAYSKIADVLNTAQKG